VNYDLRRKTEKCSTNQVTALLEETIMDYWFNEISLFAISIIGINIVVWIG